MVSYIIAQKQKGLKMKLLEKTFFKGGCYSFFIAVALLLISSAMGFDEYGNALIALDSQKTLFCAISGYTVAVAGLIFETSIDPIFKRLIHYIALLGAFVFIFATSDFGGNNLATKLLAGIILFTISYVAVCLALFGIKKLINLIIKEKPQKNEAEQSSSNKYTPLYKQ